MFTSLGDLLPKSINKRGLRQTFDAAYVCEQMRLILKDKWGPEAIGSIRPMCLKGTFLYLEAKNSGWAQQGYMNRHIFLEKLRKKIPGIFIRTIVVKRTAFRSNFVDNAPV